MTVFSERLKIARERKGFKQKTLAQKINISSQNYNHYEKGRYEPSFETLNLICSILEVSSDWLIGIKDTNDRSVVSVDSFKDSKLIPIMHAIRLEEENKIFGELKSYLTKLSIHGVNYNLATYSIDDSMRPYFKTDDIVLVNTNYKEMEENQFYLVDYDKINFIRQAKKEKSNWRLASTNNGVEIKKEANIIGKVVGNFSVFYDENKEH